jgi:hypothetical protein
MPDPQNPTQAPAEGATYPPSSDAQPNEPVAGHAPAAAAQERIIVGDAGLGEQQPVEAEQSQNTPLINGGPPQFQSGVALPEDRAAGVEANPEMTGMVAPPHSEVGSAPAGAPVTQGDEAPEAEVEAPATEPATPEAPPAQ